MGLKDLGQALENAASTVGESIGTALNNADDAKEQFAQDRANFNFKVQGKQPTPEEMAAYRKDSDFMDSMAEGIGQTAGSIRNVGKIEGIAKSLEGNPTAAGAFQKLKDFAIKGEMPSATDAATWTKITGENVPTATLNSTAPFMPHLAEGGEVESFDPDAFLASTPEQSVDSASPLAAAEFDPDQFIADQKEEKYGSLSQQALTAVEGGAEGLIGPLAPMAQKALGANEEDILGRREENPITHGIAQGATFAGSMIGGVGLGSAALKAGNLASKVAGVAKGVEGIQAANEILQVAKATGIGVKEAEVAYKAAQAATPLTARVGSEAVKQAAEMAVLSGSDEVSKMVLNDPNTSAETAIANVGLGAALGGAGGAFITGAVSPLWNATAGPQLDKLLGSVKNHMDGAKLLLPEQAESAITKLGIDVDPITRAGLSGDTRAAESYAILREGQNKHVVEGLNKLQHDASESVSRSLGIDPADVAVRSENDAGHELLDTFKKEYNQKYAPIAQAMEKRNAEAAKISISDDARLDQYGKMLEEAMNKVGTDSPAYKLYNEYGNRLLAKENIGGIDQLKTEIGNDITKAMRAGDNNTMFALRDIRNSLAEFQENQILKQASEIGEKGLGKAMVAERKAANDSYKAFAQMSGELTDHLGVGNFSGAKGLTNKLTDKVSAEQLLNKFSIKGNADFIPFLQAHFPEVLAKVQDNEVKRFLKPAVMSAKGEMPLNIKKLADMVDKGMAGQKEYIESILSPEVLGKIKAAQELMGTIPEHKSSGTAGWATKMFKGVPASAMAGIAMVTGHNPLLGGIIGHTTQLLNRDMPDALRLGYLKFLASDQPVKAEGFKAMVDFMHNTYKGENMMSKAIKGIFKGDAQVLARPQMVTENDRKKLDKIVTDGQKNPEMLLNKEQGHLAHYLPGHQTAITEATLNAVKYLDQIKPKPFKAGPLDKAMEPTPSQMSRYNRALDIAQQPTIVLQHIASGTLQHTDVVDLKSMFPGVYQQLCQKMTNEMIDQEAKGKPIPYKTRLGISLFMETPVDNSMTPSSIIAAQPKGVQAPEQQQQPSKPTDKAGTMMSKGAKSYQTKSQQAESSRSNRD